MKGSEVQYLLNAEVIVRTPRSGFKSALQNIIDSTIKDIPNGIVTKIGEGFIEVTPFHQSKDGAGMQRINLDRVRSVIKRESNLVKLEGGKIIPKECYMIVLA